ncbi:MAG: riboflavin biosynthesis protein RibF [bacterium]
MRIFTDFEQTGNIPNAVVTTGSFDGVHIGHRMILERLKKLAFEIGGETVLITFYPHPRQVLYPDTYGKELLLISSLHEKTELLRKAGLDNLIIIPFTKEFSRITSVNFVKNILVGKLHAKKIVIGHNHHFGYNREGDTEALRSLGIEYELAVEEIPEQEIKQESISSVKIRQALLEGDIEKANLYLGHEYLIAGKVSKRHAKQGSEVIQAFYLGIEESSKLLPQDGTYRVTGMDQDTTYPGSCIIQKKKGLLRKGTIFFRPDKPVFRFTGNLLTLLFHKKIDAEK